MFLKKKHLLVIVFSSLIITIVFVSTIVVYSIYIQWKKDTFTLQYKTSIYKLTAKLFEKEIVLSNVNVRMEKDGSLNKLPLFEGTLKNNSEKTITSVRIRVTFTNSIGTVVYNDWFHPLGEQYLGRTSLSHASKDTRGILPPGESIFFRHYLRNCPRDLAEQISSKKNFAKADKNNDVKLSYSITGVCVL